MASCYTWNHNKTQPQQANSQFDIPCPAGGGCCAPGDTCVSTFMCKHAEPPATANRPIYYISACTDPNYAAAACNKHCSQFQRTGVVYNNQTELWSCCGTDAKGNTLCATPSSETFQLVPPDQLPVVGVAGGSLASSTTSSSTATSSTTSATASIPTTESDHGLSSSAQAGLGVGLGLGGVIVIGVTCYFLLRRRRKAKAAAAAVGGPVVTSSDLGGDTYYPPRKQDMEHKYTSRPSPTQDALLGRRPEEVYEMGNHNPSHSELPSTPGSARVELP